MMSLPADTEVLGKADLSNTQTPYYIESKADKGLPKVPRKVFDPKRVS